MKIKPFALFALVLGVALSLPMRADKPERPPAGMGKFYLFVKQPQPAPPGQQKKPVDVPDIAKMGGRVIQKTDRYHVIFLPLAAVKHLRADQNVDYLQRVWMGESFDEWYETDSAAASTPKIKTTSDEDGPSWGPKTYHYDESGNIKKIASDSYVYDALSRVTSATVNSQSETYQYDPFGNLTQKTGPVTAAIPVESGSNRVSANSYDIAGNVTEDGNRGYFYDAVGMMTGMTGGNSGIRRMIYTADDERIGIVISESIARWKIRDFEGRVLREFRTDVFTEDFDYANWIWTEDYVYADGQLVGAETAGPWGSSIPSIPTDRHRRHFHLDHLGTVRLVTTDARQSLGNHTFYPFGTEQTYFNQEEQNLGGQGMIRPEPMRFTSHERDYNGYWTAEDTDYLDYMHARYYNPHEGRFMSVDPTWSSADLGKPQSWNRYAYVMDNPIRLVDPRGLRPFDWSNGGRCMILCDDNKPPKPEGSSHETTTVTAKDPGWFNALMYRLSMKLARSTMGGGFTEAEVAAMMGDNHSATLLMLGWKPRQMLGAPIIIGPLSGARAITFTEGYWRAEGSAIKFNDYYYNVMKNRYGAPFSAAQEILDTATEVGLDPRGMPGFFRYSNGVNEMVYNPTSGEVWHIQPLR